MPTHAPTDSAIRSQIDPFLTRISALVRQAAVGAVQDAHCAGAGGAAAPKAGQSGRRAKRSSAHIEAGTPRCLPTCGPIPARGWRRLEEIGRGQGVDTAGLKRSIQALLAAGRLGTEGQKRGTKYSPGSGKASPGAERRKAGKRGHRAAKKN